MTNEERVEQIAKLVSEILQHQKADGMQDVVRSALEDLAAQASDHLLYITDGIA